MITIEGSLGRDKVRLVEGCCRESLATSEKLTIFLQGIESVDRAGKDLLQRLVSAGVELRGIGIYERYLVRQICGE